MNKKERESSCVKGKPQVFVFNLQDAEMLLHISIQVWFEKIAYSNSNTKQNTSRETINHRLDWATIRTRTVLFLNYAKSMETFRNNKRCRRFLPEDILIHSSKRNCHINMSTSSALPRRWIRAICLTHGLWQVDDPSLPPFSVHSACAGLPSSPFFPASSKQCLCALPIRTLYELN